MRNIVAPLATALFISFFVIISLPIIYSNFPLLIIKNQSTSYVGMIDEFGYLSLKNTLEKNPYIKTLIISSNGGYIQYAVEISKLIQKYNLNVVVSKYCNSACTFIWLSAKNRFIDIDNRNNFTTHYPFITRPNPSLDILYEDLTKRVIDISTGYYFGQFNIDIKILYEIMDYPGPDNNILLSDELLNKWGVEYSIWPN